MRRGLGTDTRSADNFVFLGRHYRLWIVNTGDCAWLARRLNVSARLALTGVYDGSLASAQVAVGAMSIGIDDRDCVFEAGKVAQRLDQLSHDIWLEAHRQHLLVNHFLHNILNGVTVEVVVKLDGVPVNGSAERNLEGDVVFLGSRGD